MDIQVSTANGHVPVAVMHVNGNIDALSYEQFQSKADELIEGGARYLLVDLSKCPFISSAGLRAMHHIFNKLRALDTNNQKSEEEVRRGISAGTYKSPNLKLLKLSKESKMPLSSAVSICLLKHLTTSRLLSHLSRRLADTLPY